MLSATDWVSKHLEHTQSAAVFTDSQSLCTALVGNSPALDPLRTKLNKLPCKLTIQWIPGHSNIPGNELADAAAKSATSLKGSSPGVSYSSICTQIRAATKDPPPSNTSGLGKCTPPCLPKSSPRWSPGLTSRSWRN